MLAARITPSGLEIRLSITPNFQWILALRCELPDIQDLNMIFLSQIGIFVPESVWVILEMSHANPKFLNESIFFVS
jgi:hypothetical protein